MGVEGLDVILGGQSHTVLDPPLEAGGTLVLQSGCYGLRLGRLTLVEDGDASYHDAVAVEHRPRHVELEPQRVEQHPRVVRGGRQVAEQRVRAVRRERRVAAQPPADVAADAVGRAPVEIDVERLGIEKRLSAMPLSSWMEYAKRK